MTLKERLNKLPQVDREKEYDGSLEYANSILDHLLRFYTLSQISAHVGISRRNLSYMRHEGIKNYPMQVVLEILAGVKVLVIK